MSPETQRWLTALHLFGGFLWVGSMIAMSNIMLAHARADLGARPAFHALERKVAMMMDLGATLALAFGFTLFLKVPGMTKAGYMHAKLLLIVVALLTTHGVLRVKVRKYREGKVVPLPGVTPILLALVGLAVIVLAEVHPF